MLACEARDDRSMTTRQQQQQQGQLKQQLTETRLSAADELWISLTTVVADTVLTNCAAVLCFRHHSIIVAFIVETVSSNAYPGSSDNNRSGALLFGVLMSTVMDQQQWMSSSMTGLSPSTSTIGILIGKQLNLVSTLVINPSQATVSAVISLLLVSLVCYIAYLSVLAIYQHVHTSLFGTTVYLYDFATFNAPAHWAVPAAKFRRIAENFGFTGENLEFCMRVLEKNGLGAETSFPPGKHREREKRL